MLPTYMLIVSILFAKIPITNPPTFHTQDDDYWEDDEYYPEDDYYPDEDPYYQDDYEVMPKRGAAPPREDPRARSQ